MESCSTALMRVIRARMVDAGLTTLLLTPGDDGSKGGEPLVMAVGDGPAHRHVERDRR